MKHTKGEWKAHKMFDEPLLTKDMERDVEWYHLSYYLMDENDKVIGNIQYQTDIKNGGGFKTVNSLSEFEANAKLIAASPDLLEAAIIVCRALEIHNKQKLTGYDKLQQAIKKATS